MSLEAAVSAARFVDAARTEAMGRLAIATVGDLVRHYPFRYLDLTSTASLRDVRQGSDVTVVGRVHEVKVKKPRPRLSIVEVAIVDGTGVLLGVWFNQPYMQQRFAVGERVAFSGRVDFDYGLKQMKSPFVEKLGEDDDSVGRIIPLHRTTERLSTNWLRRLIASALEDAGDVVDHLPVALRRCRNLVSLRTALADIHFPPTMQDAEVARRRLAYDELFSLQCYMAMRRNSLTKEHAGSRHVIDGENLDRLRRMIDVTPTSDQRTAIVEILADMADEHPANRMLLGDVGTGKTLVAAHALAAVADTGSQAAMMAPTEVLAQQYAEKVGPLLDACGISWALLTGSTTASASREILSRLADGSVTVAFGTHALLESRVRFARLTLVIVDEQHRFGVAQRLGLRGKGLAPDLLVMTATPIPRSLALTLYGDLDTSYLRERPGGRPTDHVQTKVLKPTYIGRAYEHLRSEVRSGRQGYVVCALVEESEQAEAKAATRESERLSRQVFPDLRVGLLHGRMKSADKLKVMSDFRERRLDILVTTTVIEVGVDVPNATVMIVENADRFGLAQLHQLRGRVGRGEHAARVFLIADPKTDDGRARLDALERSTDGFELAEHDLRLRGEGHILGDRQHGLPELRLASVLTDADLISAAREDAQALIETDPHLVHPANALVAREVRRVYADAWKWVSSG